MFNLRANAFYLLGVSPEAAAGEIADALDDAVTDSPGDESKLQTAKNALVAPVKRLPEELSSLWGVPPDEWNRWLSTENPEKWSELPSNVARINLAAHFCSLAGEGGYSDDFRRAALDSVIESRDSFLDMPAAIEAARKKAGMPARLNGHFQEALRAVLEKHRQAAMRAIESARHPGKIMTGIVENWQYDKTASGKFVGDLARDYDRWTIPKLRPIEENILKAIEMLQRDSRAENPLDDIDRLLAEWDEYSQPVQLIKEAKAIDDPRSKELGSKLRSLVVYLANEREEYAAALRITDALHRTFPELPDFARQLASDMKELRKLSAKQAADKKIQALAKFVEKVKKDPEIFARDMAKDGMKSPGARKLAEAATPALSAFSKEEGVWNFVGKFAVALFEQGYAGAAYAVMERLAQWAAKYGAPKKTQNRLTEELDALRLIMTRAQGTEAVQRQGAAMQKEKESENGWVFYLVGIAFLLWLFVFK